MPSFKPVITLTASASLLSGCMYFGGSVEDCAEVDAPVSRVVPVDSSNKTIAVLPVTDELTKTTDNGAAKILQSDLQAIAAGRGIGLVNEENFPEIEETIELIDTGGTLRPSSLTNLDVLKSIVTDASLTYRFEQGTTSSDGSSVLTSSICNFTARIDIEARLYTGSPLQRSLTLPFSGVHQRSVESEDAACEASDELYNEMYRSAAQDVAKSIENMRSDRGVFDEQSYVRELRICFNKKYANYVWLSSPPQGEEDKGTKVKIYRQYWFKDKLKNEVEIRRSFVASGKITESENPEEVWVKIPDMNEARKVMLGDIATLAD